MQTPHIQLAYCVRQSIITYTQNMKKKDITHIA